MRRPSLAQLKEPHDLRQSLTALLLSALVVATLSILATPAAAMTFQRVEGPVECAARDCVLASGDIDKGSVGEFRAFAQANHIRPGALYILNSEGGVLMYGLALGDQIRKAGFSTTVQAYDPASGRLGRGAECASACVFAFLGGVERSVGEGSRIGVHQIYANLQARDSLSVADAQWLTALTASHIDRMGGSVEILVIALQTPPTGIHWFSGPELGQLNVITASARAITLASN